MKGLNLSLFREDCRAVLEELGCTVDEVDTEYLLDFVVRSDDLCFAVVCVRSLDDLVGMSVTGEWEEGLAEIARDAEALGLSALVVFPREPRAETLSVSAFCEHYGIGLSVTEWETLPLEVIGDTIRLDHTSATEVFLESKLGGVPEWPDVESLEGLLIGDRRVTPEDVIRMIKREVSIDWRELAMRLRWAGYSGEGFSEALVTALMSDEVEVTEDGELMHVPERLSEVLGALLVWLQNRERVPEDEVYEFLFAQFGVPYDVTYVALKKLEERGEIEVKKGLVRVRA